MAARQLRSGSDFSPVGHWTQGLARVSDALLGAYGMKQADQAAAANVAENKRIMEALLGAPGMTPPIAPSPLNEQQASFVSDIGAALEPHGVQVDPVAEVLAADAQPQQQGISPAVIEALTSPYADAATKKMAMSLYERQVAPLEQRDLINAGDGALYDPNTGQWITAPGYGEKEAKAPETQVFYDNMGREYRAQWNPQTQTWDRVGGSKLPSGMSLRMNPDGTVEFVQGAGALKPLTEGQSKDTVYATRAQGALPLLNQYDAVLSDPVQRFVENDPTGLVRGRVQSPEYQTARQAGDEFLQAILRKDTGAAITSQEQALYGKTYLPQPGDSPAVVSQKRMARARALEAMKAGMPPQAIVMQEQALRNSGGMPSRQPQPTRRAPVANKSVTEMSDAELEALANGYR